MLLTGHTGFKGSWLALWLQSLGAEVTGYSLAAPTETSLFVLADVAPGMCSVHGDVCDLEHLKRVAREHQPEIVFHLAAQQIKTDERPIEEIKAKAEGFAHDYDRLNLRDDQFDLAEALMSVSIALFGITALTRKRLLLAFGVVMAGFGISFGLAGFVGWALHPDFLTRLLS